MKIFILAVTFFIFANISHATAQGTQIFQPPNSEYKNEDLAKQQAKQAIENSKKGFMRPGEVLVSVVREDYFEDDQFGLRLKLKDTITGCFKYSPLEYQVNFVEGNYMEVAVKYYKRETIKTNNPNADCPSGNQAVSGLVVLSRSDLKQKAVTEMRLTNGGVIDRYAMAHYDDRLEIIPITMNAFKAQGLQGVAQDRLIIYNAQKDVLALHVPMAGAKDNIETAVTDLATRKGLVPLDQGDLKKYSANRNVFYFIDNGGITMSQLEDEKFIDFGTIQSTQPYEGTAGINEINKPLKVFATKPGTNSIKLKINL